MHPCEEFHAFSAAILMCCVSTFAASKCYIYVCLHMSVHVLRVLICLMAASRETFEQVLVKVCSLMVGDATLEWKCVLTLVAFELVWAVRILMISK